VDRKCGRRSDEEEENERRRAGVLELKERIKERRLALLNGELGKLLALSLFQPFVRATGGKDMFTSFELEDKLEDPNIGPILRSFVRGCVSFIKEQDFASSRRLFLTLMCGSGRRGGGGCLMHLLLAPLE